MPIKKGDQFLLLFFFILFAPHSPFAYVVIEPVLRFGIAGYYLS